MRSLPVGITDASLGDVNIRNYLFIKLTFPAPDGIVRLTNYPEGSGWTGDIDGTGSALWTNARPVKEGTVTYGRDSVVSLTTIKIGDVDYYLTDVATTHGSLREMPCELWRGHFDKNDPTIFSGSVQIYKGMIGKVRHADDSDVALVPSRSTTQSKFPKRRFTPALFPKLPGPDLVISWGATTVTPPPAPTPTPWIGSWETGWHL